MDTSSTPGHRDAPEVRIIAGIRPDNVEPILAMTAASGVFTPDVMMSAEGMAWDSAYGDGSELHTFLVATTSDSGQDTIVGFVCYGPIARWEGNFELYGIAVEPEYQRLGIGSALLSAMHRQIALQGGSRVFLETGSSQAFENACLFYSANEYVQEHRYIKQFVPANGDTVYRCDIEPANNDDQVQ